MILLPEGILDLSEDLSDDGNELGEDHSELKLVQTHQTVTDDLGNGARGLENGMAKSKLRIKTGGRYCAYLSIS